MPAHDGPNLRYIYVSCNDLAAMRRFYVELLGLKQQSYSTDGGIAWLVCSCSGFELMFFPAAAPLPVCETWCAQPGWEGGTAEGVSWSIEVPRESFKAVVEALKLAAVPAYFAEPQWLQDCYWGYPVRDPMGNTVEVFCLSTERA